MVHFLVSKDGVEKQYECHSSETIQTIKKKIKSDFKVEETDYLDIEFLLDKPIRSLGKFNLEPGILPRTMDRYELNRFELEGKNLKTTFHVVKGYKEPIIKKNITNTSRLFRQPMKNISSGESFENTSFDINSTLDFPTL